MTWLNISGDENHGPLDQRPGKGLGRIDSPMDPNGEDARIQRFAFATT